MIRFRPLPVMSVLAIISLAILITLGRWQWERFEQKTEAAAAPVAEMTIAGYQPIDSGVQFVFGFRTDTREAGWRVFTPVQDGDTAIFVDADFIPRVEVSAPNASEVRVPAQLRLGAPITGASIRPGQAGFFAAPPRPLERLWHNVDLKAMGRNAGLEKVADYYLAVGYLGADGRAHPNPFARAPGADDLPPARHLGYALTWYGLAVVMLAIYFAYHLNTGRLSFARKRRPED